MSGMDADQREFLLTRLLTISDACNNAKDEGDLPRRITVGLDGIQDIVRMLAAMIQAETAAELRTLREKL